MMATAPDTEMMPAFIGTEFNQMVSQENVISLAMAQQIILGDYYSELAVAENKPGRDMAGDCRRALMLQPRNMTVCADLETIRRLRSQFWSRWAFEFGDDVAAWGPGSWLFKIVPDPRPEFCLMIPTAVETLSWIKYRPDQTLESWLFQRIMWRARLYHEALVRRFVASGANGFRPPLDYMVRLRYPWFSFSKEVVSAHTAAYLEVTRARIERSVRSAIDAWGLPTVDGPVKGNAWDQTWRLLCPVTVDTPYVSVFDQKELLRLGVRMVEPKL